MSENDWKYKEELAAIRSSNLESKIWHKFQGWRDQLCLEYPELRRAIDMVGLGHASGKPLFRFDQIDKRKEKAAYTSYWYWDKIAARLYHPNPEPFMPLEISQVMTATIFDRRNLERAIGDTGQVRAEIADYSPLWRPIALNAANRISWIAVQLLHHIYIDAGFCPTCHQGIPGEWVFSDHQLVVAGWGVGTRCEGTGYLVTRTFHPETGKPHPIR